MLKRYGYLHCIFQKIIDTQVKENRYLSLDGVTFWIDKKVISQQTNHLKNFNLIYT